MNRVADGMESVARWTLAATVLASPWFLGGVRLSDQLWIFGFVVGSYLLWWCSNLFRGTGARLLVPWTLMLAALFVAVGVAQLIPYSAGQPSFAHALFSDWLAKLRSGPVSIEPAMTRLVVVRLGVGFLAALLATQVFGEQRDRRILWMLLVANGAALTVFGIAQRLSWNGSLFWTIPLRYGGQPFASYVNRNNAAGYLCFALAAGFGALAMLGVSGISIQALKARFKKVSLPRVHRDWDTVEIVSLALVACTFVGIFASLSRGGILAGSLTALLGILMLWRILGGRVVVYVVAMVAIPVAGAVWLNLDQSIQQRMGSLKGGAGIREDVRWQHWSDTLQAVPDAPLGSGLGTYRYLNRPYQQHAARGWYYNADNQYVETVIEAGPAGLLIVVTCLGFLVYAAFRAWRGVGDVDLRDVAVVLATLIVSQADLAFTDFGISMPANMLTLGLIVGVCLGAFPRGDRGSVPEVKGILALILGALMVSLPGTGLAEFSVAAQQATFLDSVPNLEQSIVSPEPEKIADLISEGESLVSGRPDHASLHLALAELWIYQLRTEAAAELQTLYPELHPTRAWSITSPVSLFRQTLGFIRTGDQETLTALRESSAVVKNLVPAWTHLQQAHAACPYLPKTHFLLGCLGPLMGTAESEILAHFRHDVALSPFDSDRLLATGVVLHQLDDSRTAMTLWKRALTLNPDSTHRVFQVGLKETDHLAFLNQAVPDSIPVLLKFCQQTDQMPARQQAILRLEQILPPENQATPYENWARSQLLVMEERWEEAVAPLRKAVDGDPGRLNYRLELVNVLEKLELWGEAIEQLTKCQFDAPEQTSYSSRLLELHRKQDMKAARERLEKKSNSDAGEESEPSSSALPRSEGANFWNESLSAFHGFAAFRASRSVVELGVVYSC